MGGSPDINFPSAGSSLAGLMGAYAQQLPNYLQATTGQVAPTETALTQAASQVAPAQQQLSLSQLLNYLPQFTAAGSTDQAQAGQAGATTASNIMNTSGVPMAQAELATDQAANPQYYQTLGQAGNQMSNLLNSINLNGLSDGQAAAVERATNQQNISGGNQNVPSAIGTVNNALNYGAAYTAKQNQLSSALQTATSFLPQTRANFNPISDTLSSAATAAQTNPGTAAFQPVTASSAAQNTFGAAGQVFSSANQLQQENNQLTAGQRTYPDLVNQSIGSLPSVS